MKQSIKRRLKVYLPIVASVVLIAVIILAFLMLNGVKAKDYFNALLNSKYTKQTQITTIKEGGFLIYEKTEVVVFEGDNVYQQIHERKLSDDPNTDYEETITEFYYSQSTKYYFENGVWMYRTSCIADIEADMLEIMKQSEPIAKATEKRSLRERFLSSLIRIFAPLM